MLTGHLGRVLELFVAVFIFFGNMLKVSLSDIRVRLQFQLLLLDCFCIIIKGRSKPSSFHGASTEQVFSLNALVNLLAHFCGLSHWSASILLFYVICVISNFSLLSLSCLLTKHIFSFLRQSRLILSDSIAVLTELGAVFLVWLYSLLAECVAHHVYWGSSLMLVNSFEWHFLGFICRVVSWWFLALSAYFVVGARICLLCLWS